jgi:hypothetical protein
MKVNISDLMDDFTSEEALSNLENNKKAINLNAVTQNVKSKISDSKRGKLSYLYYKHKIAAACIIGLLLLSFGSISVNAATGGALFQTLKIRFMSPDGTNLEYECTKSYEDENGDHVYVYHEKGDDKKSFTVRIVYDEAAKASGKEEETAIIIDAKDTDNTGEGVSSIEVMNKAQNDKEIIANKEEDNPTATDQLGINVEKYRNYKPGTYEEMNSDGITYKITVTEAGDVHVTQEK